MRVGHWKYIKDVNLSHWSVPTTDDPPQRHAMEVLEQSFVTALFNVEDDPTESHDLSLRYPDKLSELEGILIVLLILSLLLWHITSSDLLLSYLILS